MEQGPPTWSRVSLHGAGSPYMEQGLPTWSRVPLHIFQHGTAPHYFFTVQHFMREREILEIGTTD
jgi:hypothetical protein